MKDMNEVFRSSVIIFDGIMYTRNSLYNYYAVASHYNYYTVAVIRTTQKFFLDKLTVSTDQLCLFLDTFNRASRQT